MEKTYIIIGTSAAGLAAASALARADTQASLVCISDEQEDPYNKCFLVDYVAHHRPYNELFTLKEELKQNPRFSLILGKKVIGIDRHTRSIALNDGSQLIYYKLLLATGGSSYRLSIESSVYKGVFHFYTLADTNKVMAYCQDNKVQRAVVIGAGFSGLECAHALTVRGYTVTIIERSNRLLPSYTDDGGSLWLQQQAERMGIRIIPGATVQQFVGNAHITGIVLDNGTHLETDMVLITAGMRVNNELACQAGIELHGQHVKVSACLQTSNEHIFAAGDLIAAPSAITGKLTPNTTWADATLQGMIAGSNMAGGSRTYPGVIGYTVSHFFGHDIGACGSFLQEEESEYLVVDRPTAYRRFKLESGRLTAFLLIGSLEHAGHVCRRALLTKQIISRQELENL